jgi:hypothetical protein
MKRREFFCLAGTATVTLGLPNLLHGQETIRVRRINLGRGRLVSPGRSHSHQRIADPTGQSGADVIERFELRGGECPTVGDCRPRASGNGFQVTRTRTERIFETNLRAGDEAFYRYRMYLPTSEYNFVDTVNTTLGQVLAGFRRGDNYDSFPIFSIDTGYDNPGGRMTAQLATARETELGDQTQLPVDFANYYRDVFLRDRWVDVSVRFGLSTGSDGYVEASVNGRMLGRLEGKTILRGGFAEVRYGIYQTGPNLYPSGARNVPTQVAYFAGAEVLQII